MLKGCILSLKVMIVITCLLNDISPDFTIYKPNCCKYTSVGLDIYCFIEKRMRKPAVIGRRYYKVFNQKYMNCPDKKKGSVKSEGEECPMK